MVETKPLFGQPPLPRRFKGESAETTLTFKPNINGTQQKETVKLESKPLIISLKRILSL